MIFRSCVIVTLSCTKNAKSVPWESIWKQTWLSNDKTVIELSVRKISWFVNVSQISSASVNIWSARHWEITIFCSITSKKLINIDQWKIKQNSYIDLMRKLSDSATRGIQAALNFFTVRSMSLTRFVILFDVFQPTSTKSGALILSTWPIWACGMQRHVLITWEHVYWWETYLHSRQTCAMSGHCRKRRALLQVRYSHFLYFV